MGPIETEERTPVVRLRSVSDACKARRPRSRKARGSVRRAGSPPRCGGPTPVPGVLLRSSAFSYRPVHSFSAAASVAGQSEKVAP